MVSPDLVGQDDAERQQLLWQYLVVTFDADQRVEVEFVFTVTRDERRALEQWSSCPPVPGEVVR